MLYYTFFVKNPTREGINSVKEGLESLLCKNNYVKAEILQLIDLLYDENNNFIH